MAKKAAEAAIHSIGLGYDLTADHKFKYCKKASNLITIADRDNVRDIAIPGGILVPNVPKYIKCDKGERIRFASDILSFQQMSEQFNQEMSLSGKIPSGHFNAAFELTAGWQKDAANTKTLAFDGVFITLYNIALEKSQVMLCDHVKQAVPSSWDPSALAKFIEMYGTHIIVGVKMGGKDVVYMQQKHSSGLQPIELQQKLKDLANKMLIEETRHKTNYDKLNQKDKILKEHGLASMDMLQTSSYSQVEDIKFICKRKGGKLSSNLSHGEWCQTVQSEPDVISMSFIPITSLLTGVNGSGFLTHAINLYLRYKPSIDELHQFLEFQLPKQWAPVFGELALGPQKKQQNSASLQFSFMGPKLYVNTTPVYVDKKPVTGLRLYLEGKRGNCLAIHLQHLSSLPKTFQLEDRASASVSDPMSERKYYEKIQWKNFSHVCTAPVECDEDVSIVTGAHFEVGDYGLKKALFLRLHFSKLIGAKAIKQPEWDGSPGLGQKSGIISTLISTHLTGAQKQAPQPTEVNMNSALYPGGPPEPSQAPKLLRFVDTTEMSRGPQDLPGYWVVSGARLVVEKGKISLKVKYSLLTMILPD
ncbi:MACPF domain-containing protein NSL1 [Hibiscus syriacus]|uniref:MACPF domain-containing protein NSL1 n=2 Tax=Hibiscus syriacus TaxID=106335 RepID=A0A6A2Y4W1_HIBSY|nr:MACPF domain-containing protein At4g24290-like isoform X1 [Hibiscus syriacus]KAE8663724.1 MACPF domain-containing protein NSL1 [Hibiscus syriacus]